MAGIFDSGIFDSGIFDEQAVGETAADTVTLSDSADWVATLARTAADAPAVNGTAARIATLNRTASDTRTTSDSAIAGQSVVRTAADAPTTSDAATRTLAAQRAVAATVTTSDAATRLFSGSVEVSDSVIFYDAATRYVNSITTAQPGNPLGPVGPFSLNPVIRYGIVITVDGVDITDDVIIADASFVSMVNGGAGSCLIKVKDQNRDKSFTTGKRITLDIAGNRVWSGYLTGISRAYAFSDTSPQTRFLILDGTDINVLLHKRFVESQATPTRMLGPVYGAATKDITAIADLVGDWLDLSGDGLNTGAFVENVGNVNVDQKANLWQAGWDWAAAMSTIARLTQAIYYIDPSRHLVYTDVDSPTAPYVMSDTPTGAQVGYRELEISEDGSNLVNDALVWGIGGGSPTTVFQRLTSTSSVTTHGTWQYGATYPGAWKQATIDKIADSIVNGSPLSKRGGKNNRNSVQLVTYTPGFLPAQKVDFRSNTHGFSDVIPIRRMEVTFPAGNPRYNLTLSHEIDQPFNLIDIVPLTGVNVNIPGWEPQITTPPPHPPEPEPGCASPFDSFDRTETTTWGTADYGASYVWGNVVQFNGTASVDGSQGVLVLSNTNGVSQVRMFPNDYDSTTFAPPATILFNLDLTNLPSYDGNREPGFTFRFGDARSAELFFDVPVGQLVLQDSGGTIATASSFSFSLEAPLYVEVIAGTTSAEARIWEQTGTRPSSPDVSGSYNGTESRIMLSFRLVGNQTSVSSVVTATVDELFISKNNNNVGPCTDVLPPATPDDNPGTPTSGQLSEFAVRVTSTTYQLSRQVVAGTALILVGGVVTTAYTINNVTGLITFGGTVDPADPVYVTYTANGSIAVSPPTGSVPAGGNFTLVFDDQFDRTIAEGHFLDGGTSYTPGAAFYKTADGRYGVFKFGWSDTSGHGHYDPKIISVHDGILDLHIQTNTQSDGTWPRVATLTCLPTGSSAKGGLLGGRSRIVARGDLMLHYKGVPLWWADLATTNSLLMTYGEIDWPEASFNAIPHGFMHRTNSTSLSDQYVGIPAGSPSWQDWHEYITEWIPGTSVKWFLDGVQVGVTQTSRVPTVPMHFNLQFETALGGEPAPSPSTTGHVEIAEVQVWRYDP